MKLKVLVVVLLICGLVGMFVLPAQAGIRCSYMGQNSQGKGVYLCQDTISGDVFLIIAGEQGPPLPCVDEPSCAVITGNFGVVADEVNPKIDLVDCVVRHILYDDPCTNFN